MHATTSRFYAYFLRAGVCALSPALRLKFYKHPGLSARPTPGLCGPDLFGVIHSYHLPGYHFREKGVDLEFGLLWVEIRWNIRSPLLQIETILNMSITLDSHRYGR